MNHYFASGRMGRSRKTILYAICSLSVVRAWGPSCWSRSDCSYRGDCVNGKCICSDNWGGSHCTLRRSRNCKHGNYSEADGTCTCDPHWKTAGFTDTVDWIDGSCSQYQCNSTATCRTMTGFSGASCPIKGWNCYCGFGHLGYQTDRVGCMSFLYAFSVASFRFYREACLIWIWRIAGFAALVSLPFGSRRNRCDHHRSWLARFRHSCTGRPSSCHGECVRERRWKVRNDLSLSLYWLKVGAWWYGFLTLIGLTFVFIWSIILWILLLVAAVAAACAACQKASDSGDNNCGACGACGGDGGSCGECCGNCCCPQYGRGYYGNNVNIIYIGGPTPDYDCCYGCTDSRTTQTSSSDDCCSCSCCCTPCKPLLWMIRSYPTIPPNLHGGVVGYLMGTHITQEGKGKKTRTSCPCTRLKYIMSLEWWHRPRDLRDNDAWRTTVQQHVRPEPSAPMANMMDLRTQNGQVRTEMQPPSSRIIYTTPLTEAPITYIENIPISTHHGSIPEDTRVWNREHYAENECWICNEGSGIWYIWGPCGHVYCEKCSRSMLERSMPCPLCRETPASVDSYHVGTYTTI